MQYFVLEPEVAGGLGDHTILDSRQHPPRVSKLHYVFSGWLGDSLVETFPCFIVTQALADALRSAALSGFHLDEVEVSIGADYFSDVAATGLPHFEWLRVSGIAGHDDFGISADHRMVVSERAIALLRKHSVANCGVETWAG